jgi:hypothetical protein
MTIIVTSSGSTGVTVVQGEWLPRLVPSLTIFDKPLEAPAPHYNVVVSIHNDAKLCCF